MRTVNAFCCDQHIPYVIYPKVGTLLLEFVELIGLCIIHSLAIVCIIDMSESMVIFAVIKGITNGRINQKIRWSKHGY